MSDWAADESICSWKVLEARPPTFHGTVFAVLMKNDFMGTDNKPSMNQQDHPHREGQQQNTTPQVQGTGQRVSENKTQQMSDMLNESEEQKTGRAQGQNDEGSVQQEEQ